MTLPTYFTSCNTLHPKMQRMLQICNTLFNKSPSGWLLAQFTCGLHAAQHLSCIRNLLAKQHYIMRPPNQSPKGPGVQKICSDRVAIVIPCYRTRKHILGVLLEIGRSAGKIYVVDDCCPEKTADHVEAAALGPHIQVLRHSINQGVGAATLTGYAAAIADGYEVIVKMDGDGQMDPALLPELVNPILKGEADYTKGNRFFDIESVRSMPRIRLFGNSVLSFFAKFSTGYWQLFDPTNGYTAIHADVARHLPANKLSRRYFFETDMLFRLNTLRAVVVDVPMEARYGDEVSNLKIGQAIVEFALKHAKNFFKRLFYNYYLRDLSLASFELPVGVTLFILGSSYGAYHWLRSYYMDLTTPAGTVMLAAILVLLGTQLILAFFGSDIANVPTRPISRSLRLRSKKGAAFANNGGRGAI